MQVPASVHMLTAVPDGTMSLRNTRSPLAVFSTWGEAPFIPSETASSVSCHSTTACAEACGRPTARRRARGKVLKYLISRVSLPYFVAKVGSKRSRNPSPSNVAPTTATLINSAGHKTSNGYTSTYCWVDASMRPHDGVGGVAPRPK